MKYLKFPLVVQKEIFEHMIFEELFLLSLCSKRVKNLIHLVQKARIKRVNTITYFFAKNKNSTITVKSSSSERIMRMKKNKEKDGATENREEGELESEENNLFCFSGSSLIYDLNHRDSTMETIHTLLKNFFEQVEYQIKSRDDLLPPNYLDIKNCEISLPRKISPHKLDVFFNNFPLREYVKIIGSFNGNLDPNSKLYEAEHLEIDGPLTQADDILYRFKGQNLYLENATFYDETIYYFLEMWKSGQGFQNLEKLVIRCGYLFRFKVDQVKESVGVRTLDEAKGALYYEWQKRANIHPVEYETQFIRTPNYIVREQDGQVAYVFITETFFTLVVWNPADEEQFVEIPEEPQGLMNDPQNLAFFWGLL